MNRRDFYNDPSAPTAQRIVPAVTAFVTNDKGDVLLERRSDNGRWGMPGGVQEIGESITQTVVREVREETGMEVEVTGLVGVYTDPGHVISFTDTDVRQEFSLCFRARPVGGVLATSRESIEVRWIPRNDLPSLNASVSTRRRISDALIGRDGPVLA
jgi:ADP-ribose pyrophosphatase YjhB (NUDIX family)